MSKNLADQPPNLAFVGMHGPPEVTGLALHAKWPGNEVADWQIEIANPAAVAAGDRYVDCNLATCFDEADPNSPVYEHRRAAELIKIADGRKIVLDIHDRPGDKGEYALVGERCTQSILNIIGGLGMRNIIVYRGNRALVSSVPAVVLDFCRGSHDEEVETNVRRLQTVMQRTASHTLQAANPEQFQYFTYVQEISSDDAHKLGLPYLPDIAPFDPLPPTATEPLQLPPGEFVAEYWNGDCSAENMWFGGVLQKIPPISLQ